MRRSLAILVVAAAFGSVAQFLFYGHRLGINVVLAVLLLLAIVWVLRVRAIDRADLWIPVSTMTFAALIAIRTEPAVVAFDALAVLGLAVASVAAFGAPLTRIPLIALMARGLEAGVMALFGAGRAIADERAHPGRATRVQPALPYLTGVGLSVPLLFVFGRLFAAADAVFAHALDLAFHDWLPEAPGRLLLAIGIAWVTAGLLVLLKGRTTAFGEGSMPRPLRSETGIGLLVTVDLLFAAFVAIDLTYLFGGRDTVEAAGVTYSEYGRRGFFELVAVATIVAALLFALDLFIDRRRRAYVLSALSLIALTGVVVASAAFRMDLYQRAYGWSELRFHAFAGIAFLSLVLLILAWAVVAGRTSFAAQPIIAAAALVAVAVNLIGPSTFVARMNVARVIDPGGLPADAERRLDVGYLVSLGDAALPVLVEALPCLPSKERFDVESALRPLARTSMPSSPWEEWNWDRQRARDAIDAIAAGRAAASACSASGR